MPLSKTTATTGTIDAAEKQAIAESLFPPPRQLAGAIKVAAVENGSYICLRTQAAALVIERKDALALADRIRELLG
jgi:hypothetical protein